ncbi:chalcone isomerase family protein [Spiribacter vilamensis]|uniref:Chalcone isomerase-like protein n=1 Tax=Spiribacter vilamensis TaxID=531306 RepID=A0A4Q8CYF8_9GAMM|nr:chalcone isomerase family protein [Spiribacter vilamensis]RZU98026.1 chalcone isomerase-like protein [Spiribacter vilamensis]
MARILLATLMMLTLGLTSAANAAVVEKGARFEERIDLDGERLELTGTGIVKYRIVFTVYAAGLYLPPNTSSTEVLAADTPRRLEIEYFHDISADDIIRGANTKLAEQLSASERDELQPKIERFHSLFQAVSDGDRYRMEYVPGEGTRLSFNGEPVGQVEGEAFAAAYFGIWLDADNPLSTRLRDGLLTDVNDTSAD